MELANIEHDGDKTPYSLDNFFTHRKLSSRKGVTTTDKTEMAYIRASTEHPMANELPGSFRIA